LFIKLKDIEIVEDKVSSKAKYRKASKAKITINLAQKRGKDKIVENFIISE
jgi:hypothetical protein